MGVKQITWGKMMPGNNTNTLPKTSTEIRRRIAALECNIKSLNQYIMTNRHDRQSVRDAEKDISEYNAELTTLRNALARCARPAEPRVHGSPAAGAIPHPIPHPTMPGATYVQTPPPEWPEPYICTLYAARRVLNDRLMQLGDAIDACEININPSCRTDAIVQQSQQDLAHYTAEYEKTCERLNHLALEIAQWER